MNKRDLDNHITGHYGEDQFAMDPAEVVDRAQCFDPIPHDCGCEYCKGLPKWKVNPPTQDKQIAMLNDILAVIHRDGGHYTSQHGVGKSCADAITKWGIMQQALEEIIRQEECESEEHRRGFNRSDKGIGFRDGLNSAKATAERALKECGS